LRKQQQAALTEEALKMSSKSFEEAQEMFKNAVNSMPSGWSIAGMSMVDGLVSSVGMMSNTLSR